MQPKIKALAERLLLRGGAAAIARHVHAGRSLVLAYHNVVPDGEPIAGEAPLHIRRREFSEQLDALLESGVTIASLDEVARLSLRPEPGDRTRRVAITLDDAYAGAVDVGIGELVRRNLPATVFVAPGLLGRCTFWWDALSASGAGMSPETRSGALNAARGRNEEVLSWARRNGLEIGEVPDHARSATEAEVRSAVSNPEIELGSHSWSHPNLAALTDSECEAELGRASDWLRREIGAQPRWLSYPYGLWNRTTELAAAAVGHRAAFRIDGGWLPRSSAVDAAFRLPRLNVAAGLSRDGLALRLAGLLCG